MAVRFLPQVLPQAPGPLNFQPVANALAGIRQQQNQNALMDQRQAEFEAQQAMQRDQMAAVARRHSEEMDWRAQQAKIAQQNADRAYGLQRDQFGLQSQRLDLQRQEMKRALAKRQQMIDLMTGGAAPAEPQPAGTLTGDARPGPIAQPQAPQQAAPPQGGLMAGLSPQGRKAMMADYMATGGRNWGKIIQDDSAKSLTPAQKAIDESFAKGYGDFVVQGGSSDVAKNLQQLDFAIAELKKGGVSGTVPGFAANNPKIGTVLNPRAVEVKNAIDEVTQRNLREVLGGQFAMQEGQQLIDRAYQPYADEKDNMRRVQRLRTAIANAYKQKMRAARYFEANGTLQGFKGELPTLQSIEKDAGLTPKSNEQPTQKQPSSGVFTLPDGRKARRASDGSWEFID